MLASARNGLLLHSVPLKGVPEGQWQRAIFPVSKTLSARERGRGKDLC